MGGVRQLFYLNAAGIALFGRATVRATFHLTCGGFAVGGKTGSVRLLFQEAGPHGSDRHRNHDPEAQQKENCRHTLHYPQQTPDAKRIKNILKRDLTIAVLSCTINYRTH